jgi:hypothetical protein
MSMQKRQRIKRDPRVRVLLGEELKRLAEARAKENGESVCAYIRRAILTETCSTAYAQ